MKNIKVCFAIAKEFLQPLGLQGYCKNDEKFLQAALVYLCENGVDGTADFADKKSFVNFGGYDRLCL